MSESTNPSAPIAKPGKRVTVKYVGRLQTNGKVFDSTKGNKTFSFRLGAVFFVLAVEDPKPDL